MTPKPPTPQAISALLRKAGFKRSEVDATRNHGDGYVVRKWDDFGRVEVAYTAGFGHWSAADREHSDEMLARCAGVITTAGWTVGDRGSHLIVAARKESGAPGPQAVSPLMAAPRDATAFNRPGRATQLHIASTDMLGACNGNPLAEFAAMPAGDVPEHRRCCRPGCRARWPSVTAREESR